MPTLPPPPPLTLTPAVPHLSEENLQQLALARTGGRKVRRAISVASFDGWTIGVFAALTLLFSLTDLSGLFVGLGLGMIACIELRGANKLRRLEPKAVRMLAFNQIALGILLLVYSVWRIVVVMKSDGAYAAVGASDPQLARMLQPVENLTRMISLAVYAALIGIAVFAQGGLALFYFTREKHLQAYLMKTPAWIVAMQRAGITI